MIGFYFRFIISFLALSPVSFAETSSLMPSPVFRCEQFLNPLYGDQILVFSPLAYQHIQNHPISLLARQLREKHIALDFTVDGVTGGYFIQRRTIERLLQELFPPPHSTRPQEWTHSKIDIKLPDSAMFGKLKSNTLTDFEMPLLKSGNPMVVPLSKGQVRADLNISDQVKLATFYADSIEGFADAFSAIQTKPEVVIISTKFTTLTSNRRTLLKSKFPDYEVLTLTELKELPKHPIGKQRYLVFNDTNKRMLEIYTASDYAVVLGSSNIFEPLQAKCPVIYFKNSDELENKLLTGYEPHTWKGMGDLAEQTKGAIGIVNFSELQQAVVQIETIRPETILHPAFVIPKGKTQCAFDDILNQIEKLIRFQILD